MTTKSFSTGLTEEQVLESRRVHGDNVLTPAARESLFRKFLHKFQDQLIIILLVAAVLSILIACYEFYVLGLGVSVFFEPLGIIIAVLLATGLAFYFEMRAEREFAVLTQVNDDIPVRVVRNGHNHSVPRRDIVVGDFVLLDTGDEVPADGTLLSANSLKVDESTLTGEPICSKTVHTELFDAEATFPSNRVLRGTKVMEGNGSFLVEAVGDHTENGRVFRAAQIDNGEQTPLSRQLDKLSILVSRTSYVLAALILVGRTVEYFLSAPPTFNWIFFAGYLLSSIMIAVTIIVMAVPEGLPMAVTLSLAYSMRRLLKANNLVRHLHACETMGATTVICTDKTGTLTENRMRVAHAEVLADMCFAEALAVNSTATLDDTDTDHIEVLGNPTEGALLLWLSEQHHDYEALRSAAAVIDQIPFSTERKYMATLVQSSVDGQWHIYLKGASEILFHFCPQLDESRQKEILKTLFSYQQRAFRTLGFVDLAFSSQEAAETELSALRQSGTLALPDAATLNSTFQGYVAISDPVRAEVSAAIRCCLTAGIGVKIVTGDTLGTAREIGRQVGICSEADSAQAFITGPEFAALSDEELIERVGELKVIARARPMDKKRLVEALQKRGEVVAVTGDGTNDAPALKAAHVGLSMGDGTSVAKEASDITIIDNSFSSIVNAVMWGRSLYKNIQRFILFQLTVNVAACLIVLIGSFMGTQSPLTVTQILWVNLIMDTFAAVALASLPPSSDVMEEQPRAREAFIITPAMRWNILLTGFAFTGILLVALYVLKHFYVYSLCSLPESFSLVRATGGNLLSDYELSIFFTFFVLLQFWNLFNARSFATPQVWPRLRGCRGFFLIAGLILLGQVLIVNLGGPVFNVVPLSLSDWLLLLVTTSVVLWVGIALRVVRHRK